MNVLGLEAVFSCKGYRVEYARTDGQIMQVNLAVDRRFTLKCPLCKAKMSVNRTTYSFVKDLPLGSVKCVLIRIPVRQGRCTRCHKTHTFRPDIVEPNQKATNRFIKLAAAFCQYMPATKVAEYFNVPDTTIRNYNKRYLKAKLKDPELDNLRYLLVDEKSIGKGHSYVTLVLNALSGDLLHMAEGKKKESLKSFFDKLINEQKAAIKAVCIDRSGSYSKCIKECLPNAELVYDKFHLVMNLNGVIDKIRRNLWNNARQNKDFDQADLIKGQRYNLLRNKCNNTASQQRQLDKLLRANAPLSEAYLLLDSFKFALSQSDSKQMHDDLTQWVSMGVNSCRAEMVSFARNIGKVIDNVTNAAKFKLTNGLIESFNRKIAMVIRRACGYRNLEYLFLNLRQIAKKPIPL